MNNTTYTRLSATVLIIHGVIEILALLMFVLPPELLPVSMSEDAAFWALMGGLYGSLRILSAVSICRGKKSGIVFGIILSIVTMVVAPSIQPFGLLDLPMAALVLWALLTLWFDDEKL